VHILINDGWEFALKTDEKQSPEFAPVSLPHDWLIYDTNNLYADGVGVYKRKLDATFLKEGQKLILCFDGVYMDSTLRINGNLVGEWKNGYTPFKFDITEYVERDIENELVLEVNHQSPNSRWYSGAGIYRDVSLIVKNPCHIVTNSIYISTSMIDGHWNYHVETEVETNGQEYEIRHELPDEDSEIIAWDIDNPHLYTLRSELSVKGEVVDVVFTRFGFREIEFTTDRGFFLNGRHVKLKGVCMHHDLGALGAATHKEAIRRQFDILREMGVNALRTAHNPPSAAFMELADEMGFLVMSELTDMWEHPKTKYDYARFFDKCVEDDIAAWIRRDRNSPSVIMWSIGNEIYDTHASAERGGEIMRRLIENVEKHDHMRNAYVTFSSNYMAWENTQKCADIIKLVGYNYAEYLYEDHHKKYPDWIIYGGETSSTIQSRNIYRFPLSQSMLADDDLQCSSLGNCSTSWGAETAEICALTDKNTEFSLGQFLWSGFDYIGEPTPYHTKNSYFGQIDTAGFPKDSFYIHKAAWVDEPVLHIFPYWDFSPGQIIDVRVATNAHSVELFLNNESLGKTALNGRLIADWKVPYEEGELRAVGYDKDGNILTETTRSSFGEMTKLLMSTEVYGQLHFVSITALDKNKNIVENANNRVHISVKDGTLLAMDNGDSTDFEQYKTDNKRLFGGRLLAIVEQTGDKAPKVTAKVCSDDIPIRKIDIVQNGNDFEAKIFPKNATHDDIRWRLTNAAGADSPLGELTCLDDKRRATLVPRGDGEVWIRCSAKNGKEHDTVISQRSMELKGLGRAFVDPYSFVAGAISNLSNIKLTNGNERGIATSREEESHVGFSDLDFGSFGSDELNVPIFTLTSEPFEFEIWEGMPESGGEKLTTVLYDKGMIWNTYQDVPVKLPRRLRGVTTLCFIFRLKVHIKGFEFKSLSKGLTRLNAAENDGIYGDSYVVKDDAIESIGNNVSILFENMDFTERGVERVRICRRSTREKNSMQIRFTGDNMEYKAMIDIPGASDYSEAVFDLGEKISGNLKVELVFLPGCEIDLRWIEFF